MSWQDPYDTPTLDQSAGMPGSRPAGADPGPGFLERIELGDRQASAQADQGLNQSEWERRAREEVRRALAARGHRFDFQTVNRDYLRASAAERRRGFAAYGNQRMWRILEAERQHDQHLLSDYADVADDLSLRRWAARARVEELERIDRAAPEGLGVAGFIGQARRALRDPLSYIPVPGGPSLRAGMAARQVIGQALRVGRREALANVAVTAAIEPLVREDARRIGVERTNTDLLYDLGASAVAGQVLGTAAEGLPHAARALRGGSEAATLERELSAVYGEAMPPHARDALHVIRRENEIANASPFERTPAGDDAHANGMEAAHGRHMDREAGVPDVPRVSPPPRSAPAGTGPGAVAAELRAGGLPEPVVAGFLGNFEVEAGYGGARGDGGSAFGIAQWRHERVANFERVIGVHPSRATHRQQARFVRWEMENPGQAGMTVAQRDAILAARTPEEAARLIDQFYERSSGAHRQRRAEAAARHAGGEASDAPPARPEAGEEAGAAFDMEEAMLARELAEAPQARPFRFEDDEPPLGPAPVLRRDLFDSDAEWETAQAEVSLRHYRGDEIGAPEPAGSPLGIENAVDAPDGPGVATDAQRASQPPVARPSEPVDPAGVGFGDWMEETLGTRRWMVANRLGSRQAERYDLAVPPKRYAELERQYYEANGYRDGVAPEGGSVPFRDGSEAAARAMEDRILARAEAGFYGARSKPLAERIKGERAELADYEAAIAADRAEAARQGELTFDNSALRQFDDPAGEGPKLVAESLLHDLRAELAADPALTERTLYLDDGDKKIGELLAELDDDVAAAAALRTCLGAAA